MVKRVLKIYIAGPMTGYPDYNRAAFNAKASELMSEGHIVLNPAVLPGGLCQSEYMDICLALRTGGAIYTKGGHIYVRSLPFSRRYGAGIPLGYVAREYGRQCRGEHR